MKPAVLSLTTYNSIVNLYYSWIEMLVKDEVNVFGHVCEKI